MDDGSAEGMGMYIVTIDLGTTNIKVGLYDKKLKELCMRSVAVNYVTQRGFVEFDAEEYWKLCKRCVTTVILESGIDPNRIATISLTGQAESLILVDKNMIPLRNGISWLDCRSVEECEVLKRNFDTKSSYGITGQVDIIPTWPVTKILWIREHERNIFKQVSMYLLLKDFIIYELTGRVVAEYTVYNFSYYLDIFQKKYWTEILDFIGVRTEQLPEFVEPGERVGTVRDEVAEELGIPNNVTVNSGALDHFAGMIGTGNIEEGIVSETTGTVLAIATMTRKPGVAESGIPCQYNAIRDTFVLMPVCESGGLSLEWFKNSFYPKSDYAQLNSEIERNLEGKNEVVFLPYLTGTNAPECDVKARGVFYGLNVKHGRLDMARAVMEGVAFLLKKNIEYLEGVHIGVKDLISLGGGAKSWVWNQIKADVTGKQIRLPEYEEATSLGAAILAAVDCGIVAGIHEAVDRCIRMKKVFVPVNTEMYREGYEKFLMLYDRLTPVFHYG